jgi:hypothetical protein
MSNSKQASLKIRRTTYRKPDIFTRHTWPDNPARVAKILSDITIDDDITEEERVQLENFI